MKQEQQATSQESETLDCDVAIVGGGPVGLTLAIGLGQRGHRVVLVNERATTTDHPRLDVLNPRTMEIYRRMGLVDAVRRAGNRLDQHQHVAAVDKAGDAPVWKLDAPELLLGSTEDNHRFIRANGQDGSLPLEPMHRLTQIRLEPVLLNAANSLSTVEVRFGWRMVTIQQDAESVLLRAQEVSGAQRKVTVRARYAVGCDGPRSATRAALGIHRDGSMDLVGELMIVHFRSRALKERLGGVPPWHTWSLQRNLTGMLVCPNGDDEFVFHKAVPCAGADEIEPMLRRFIGAEVDLQILQHGKWQPQFLVAESFGQGRIWLAGDATHQYMPTGGMGLNTGIVEADNLCWKLDAMLGGWGGEALLESYDAERRPIAFSTREHVRLSAAASFDVRFGMHSGPRTEQETRELAEAFERKLKRLYVAWGAEFGYCYLGSPIIVEDGEPVPSYDDLRYTPTTRAGCRLPSMFREDGSALFDELSRGGFTLLVTPQAESRAMTLSRIAEDSGVPMKVLRIREPAIGRVMERDLVLVRPDEIVAWRGSSLPSHPSALVDRIRGRH